MVSPNLPAVPDLLDRGVYQAPWLGPKGERVLVAVDHNHQHLTSGMRYLTPDENPYTAHDELWSLLDEVDPLPPQQPRGQLAG